MGTVAALHPEDVGDFKALGEEILFYIFGGTFHRDITNHYPQDLFLRKLIGVVGNGLGLQVFGKFSVVIDGVKFYLDAFMDFPGYCETNVVSLHIRTCRHRFPGVSEDHWGDSVSGLSGLNEVIVNGRL